LRADFEAKSLGSTLPDKILIRIIFWKVTIATTTTRGYITSQKTDCGKCRSSNQQASHRLLHSNTNNHQERARRHGGKTWMYQRSRKVWRKLERNSFTGMSPVEIADTIVDLA
jgi:hypothetical protein